MAESSTEAKARKAVHPFFATRTEETDSPVLRVTGRTGVDDLLKKTILNITHLAAVGSSSVRSQRSSLLGSLDPDCVAPSLSTEARLAAKSADSTEERQRLESGNPLEPESPLSPGRAVRVYREYLTQMELAEIGGYKEVYFLGLGAEKVRVDITLPNCGYDDEHSDYKVTPGDHLDYRYEILRVIGKGAFGKVLLCFDHRDKQEVAVKVVRNARRFHRQVMIEVQVLESLRDMRCQCVIGMKGHFKFREHICMTFELLDVSLFDCLKQNGFHGFPLDWVRSVILQLIVALKELKRCQIIHSDVKPENVLFTDQERREVRLIDFGSACYEKGQMYTYLQSRFYRAPEVILGVPYSFPIDIWSLGCVTAELFTGHPLFPGENEKDQLQWQMSALGLPPTSLLSKAAKMNSFFTLSGEPRAYVTSRGVRKAPGSLPLERLIPDCDLQLLGFISSCLQWDPETRITPEEAETHPFFLS